MQFYTAVKISELAFEDSSKVKALFPIRVDDLQKGAAFHFTKYAAFFDPPPHKAAEDRKELGRGGNFGADVRPFLVKKSFSPFPSSHLPLSRIKPK